MKQALARIASKNHANGARNPRAQFRKEMTVEQLLAMPRIAGELSVFDCAGVADGAAAAVVVRAEDAHRYSSSPLFVKGLSFVVGDGSGVSDPDYDYTTFPEVVASAHGGLPPGGHHRPAFAARHGRGARLLHPDGAGPDGGSRVLRARQRLEGRALGVVRPRPATCR